MTEPISLIVGVVSITTAVGQSSQTLLKLATDIRNGPEDIYWGFKSAL
jgi:hypothetical protein